VVVVVERFRQRQQVIWEDNLERLLDRLPLGAMQLEAVLEIPDKLELVLL